MRVSRVALGNFKGLKRLDEELAPGLNIVHGPNEAGKSSFLEALRAAFFDLATTTAREKVGRWVPWGTDATPEVALEFEAGGTRYRLEKSFARGKGRAKLVDLDSRQALADSPRAVQDRLGRILRMGDAAFLCSAWAEQGRIEDALREAGAHEDLRARLREASVDATSPVDVAKAVGRKRKALCPPRALRETEEALREAGRKAGDLARRRGHWRELDEKRDHDEARLAEVEKRLEEISPLLDKDGSYHEAAKLREDAKGKYAAAERSLGEAEEAGRKLGDLERQRAGAEGELADARSEEAGARAAVELAEKRGREREIAEALSGLDGIECEIGPLAGALSAPAPGADELAAMEALGTKATELGARLEAAELKVEVEALGEIALDSDGGSRSLSPGERAELRGDAEVVFEIANVARVRARGPVQDLAALRRELDECREDLAGRLAGYGVSSVGEARSLGDTAGQAERDLRRLERERSSLLGRRTRRDLEGDLAALRGEVERLSREVEVKDAPADAAGAAEAARVATSKRAALEERLKGFRDGIAYWKGRQVDLERLRKTKEEEGLRFSAADTAARALERYRMAAEDHLALSNEGGPLEKERTKLAAALDLARRQRPLVSDEDVARAEDERDALERRLRLLEREKSALKLVEDAYARAREEFAESDEEVIRACIERVLPALTANRYESADLDASFSVAKVSGPAADEADVGALSVGAKEQLALALRLALVEALSRGERQLVVLDEALIGFDGERTKAACGILAEHADRFQIVVLTARPELLKFPKGTKVKKIKLGGSG